MAAPTLTVVIPTYDRPQHLKNLVTLLLPQRNSNWKLLIVDNHSPTPVRDLVPSDVEVVRNPANISAAGNFPRCFELMTTDWVWMIGDDDLVDADAADHVLKMIEAYPNAAILNFGRQGGTDGRKEALTLRGFDEFLSGCDSVSESVWMSGNVYSRRHYWPYLGLAYRFANTCSSHYVLLMMSLLSGGSYVQLPRAVCRQATEVASSGNHGELVGNVMALVDLPLTRGQRRKFTRLMQKVFTRFTRDVIQCAYHLAEPDDRYEILYQFYTRWTRWAIARGSPGLFAAATIARVMLGCAAGRLVIRALVSLKNTITGRPTVIRPHVPRFFRGT